MVCSQCKEEKNIDNFRMSTNRHKNPYQVKACRSCEAERARIYNKKIRGKAEYKKEKAERANKWKSENEIRYKKYIKGYYQKNIIFLRERVKKQVDNLDDAYVITVLTKRNPELRQLVKKYPQLIRAKREQMLLNRTIKNK